MTNSRPSPDAPATIPALSAILAVARFQLARMLTPPRLAMAALGIVFPTAILLASKKATGEPLPFM